MDQLNQSPPSGSPLLPDIETRGTDRAIGLAKQIASAFPGIGPVVAQLLLDDIPGQRMDRIADYVRLLNERIGALEFETKMRDPEARDLFEEGALKSTRATSEARREHIASVVASGINGDDQERIQAKRLLDLLSEIDDAQVVILSSFLHRHLRDTAFLEKHAAIVQPRPAHLGATREAQDQALVADLARSQLVQLGLLKDRFARIDKGKVPEFDEKTGRMKSQGRDLTPLARLLLRRIGLATEEEY